MTSVSVASARAAYVSQPLTQQMAAAEAQALPCHVLRLVALTAWSRQGYSSPRTLLARRMCDGACILCSRPLEVSHNVCAECRLLVRNLLGVELPENWRRPPGRPARGERPGPHRPPAEHRPQPPLSPREHRRPEGLPARDGRGGVARTAPRRGFWCYMPTTIATARTPTTCATARTPTTPRTPGGTASTERGTPDDDPEAPRYREATAKMRHSPCVDAALLEFKS